MAPKVLMETHNMSIQIEYEPLPWYLDSAVINPDTGDILQYKYLIQLKNNKQETSGKTDCQNIMGDLEMNC